MKNLAVAKTIFFRPKFPIIILILIMLSVGIKISYESFCEYRKINHFVYFCEKVSDFVKNETITEKSQNEISVDSFENIRKQALEIKEKLNNGRNSVTIENSTGLIRYDLDGKAHANIPTPHKQEYIKNSVNGEVKSISRATKNPAPLTQQDIDLIKLFFNQKK